MLVGAASSHDRSRLKAAPTNPRQAFARVTDPSTQAILAA